MSVADKYKSLVQTGANKPKHRMIISRVPVPLSYWKSTHNEVISESSYVKTVVAVKRDDISRTGTKAYVLGLDSSGSVDLYTSALNITGKPYGGWTKTENILTGVSDISIAFQGRYLKAEDKIEFLTEDEPWIGYVSNGTAYLKRLGAEPAIEISSGADKIDICMGINAQYSGYEQGLIVMYTLSADGAILYRQYDTKTNQLQDGYINVVDVSTGENLTGVLSFALSRTWDYRLAILYATSAGMYRQLTRSIPSAFANNESVDVENISVDEALNEIVRIEHEQSEIVDVGISQPDMNLYPLDPALIVNAVNIDDGIGNYGVIVEVEFSYPVGLLEAGSNGFCITGNSETYAVTNVQYKNSEHKILVLPCADFNALEGYEAAVEYDSSIGSLYSFNDVTKVENQSFVFTPVNLVSPDVPPPVLLSVINIEGSEL